MTEENISERPELTSPLTVAATVIEEIGYSVDAVVSEQIVGFGIPNGLGSDCEAIVQYLHSTGTLQITTALTSGQVNEVLFPGLIRLLNELNLLIPGVRFTFDPNEADGDEIEISISCFAFEELELERHIKLMLVYLEKALQNTLPAIYYFVAQKLVCRFDEGNVLVSVRSTVTMEECIEMVEMGNYGTA